MFTAFAVGGMAREFDPELANELFHRQIGRIFDITKEIKPLLDALPEQFRGFAEDKTEALQGFGEQIATVKQSVRRTFQQHSDSVPEELRDKYEKMYDALFPQLMQLYVDSMARSVVDMRRAKELTEALNKRGHQANEMLGKAMGREVIFKSAGSDERN